MAQKSRMITCTCGNTDLEKIGVRLQLTGEDGKTISLFALLCRGDGCGRVTFRPQEAAIPETTLTGKPTNGHFTESAKVIEGARLVEGAKLVDQPRAVDSGRPIESGRFVEGARLIESPKKPEIATKDLQKNEGPKGVAALFERVYKERLVYKAIAERDPSCHDLFDALKKNDQICSGITAAFGRVYERLEANEDLLTALRSLPSMAPQE